MAATNIIDVAFPITALHHPSRIRFMKGSRMSTFKKIFTWLTVIILVAFALDESNNSGSRAVAMIVVSMIYLRGEFSESKRRHDRVLLDLVGLDESIKAIRGSARFGEGTSS